MFRKADADKLREGLAGIEFLGGDAAPETDLGAASPLYDSYKAYYGLNFGESDSRLGDVSSTIGVFESGSFELVCQHFLPSESPPRKTAFLLHGYFDHAGLYRHIIAHLLGCNIAVVIFDLPGHGLSSGATASITSFKEYSAAFVSCLRLAREQRLQQPWTFMGQSTGGAVIMEAFLDNSLPAEFEIEQSILLAPLLRPRHWSRSKVLFSLSRLFVTSTPRKFSKNSHDEEFLKFLSSEDDLQSRILPRDWVQAMIDFINRFEKAPPQNQAFKIIQGRGDGTVHWEQNIPKILEKFRGSEVEWIDEAGHHLVNESIVYREQLFAIIDKFLEGRS